ncbi:MAG: hypothetical protein J7K23_03835 [Thermoproteales archaeon]|nr:hypothetical protein [Thermoproteales archaeon]
MKSEKRLLDPGIYRVYGPIKLTVVDGSIFHFGRWVSSTETIIVPADETTSFYIEKPVNINITYHTSNQLISSSEKEEPILEWRKKANEIISKGYRLVIVLGETDSGKSSFTGFLANYAFQNGFQVNIIDSDVGQNDIGYPGCISSVKLTKTISWLRELHYERLYFVGSITPSENIDSVILGIKYLIEKIRKENSSSIIIINTDGWIEGIEARKYKTKLVMSITPDAIVVMTGRGKSSYLYKYFKNMIPCYLLSTPTIRKIKHRSRRKLRREISYIDIFLNGKKQAVNIDKTPIVGSLLFSGSLVSREVIEFFNKNYGIRILHMEINDNTCIIVLKNPIEVKIIKRYVNEIKSFLNVNKVVVLCIKDIQGIIVGLLGEKFEHLGIGIIQKIDFQKKILHFISSATRENLCIKGIILGNIKIERDGSETKSTTILRYI